ncbi:uncharacterized protein STEHIDRAFT_143246 [Stereum hirsutum FP-91666 SS1]|uniref:Uncharacterized protein n=1 Tax=Stereum hirsutum (strain FP-91666) TaxID=721885 RepID=R7RWX7_STEHR|nr:uncharacterized protein STEHIDRAFT_143246 [Stereum hirsutum FP-91666 SS1]EIM79313.1 hypothetical protein STEHIDRAFT_143246 [Stereum hirsutum FP-91666 SS1]
MNPSDSDHEQQEQPRAPSIVLANTPITANHPAAPRREPEAVELGRKRKFGEYDDRDEGEGEDDDGDGDTETISSDGEGPTSIIAPGGVNSRSSQSTPPSKRHHPDSDGHDSSEEFPSSHITQASNSDVRALHAQHSSGTSSPSNVSLLLSSSTGSGNANPIATSEAQTVRSTTTITSEGHPPSTLQYYGDMSAISAIAVGNDGPYSDADRRDNTSPSPIEEITTEGARGLNRDDASTSTSLPRPSPGFTSTFNGRPCPSIFNGRPCPSTSNALPPTSNGNGNGNGGNDFFMNFVASQMRANRAASEAEHAFLSSLFNPHSRSGSGSSTGTGTNFSAAFGQHGVNVHSFTTASVPVVPVVSRSVPVVQAQPFLALTPPSLPLPHTFPHTFPHTLPHTLPLQTPPQPVYTLAYGHATPTPTPTLLPTTTNINNTSLRSVPPLAYTLPTRVTRTLNQTHPGGAPGLLGFHAPSYA